MPLLKKVFTEEGFLVGVTEEGVKVALLNPVPFVYSTGGDHRDEIKEAGREDSRYFQVPDLKEGRPRGSGYQAYIVYSGRELK